MEQSLVILKPDALERKLVGEIISRFERVGLKFAGGLITIPSEDILRQHYPDSLASTIGEKSRAAGTDIGPDPVEYGRMVLGWNRKYMMRGPVMVLRVEGPEGTVQRIRDLVGSTNPPKACPGTIRFDLGIDSIERANSEKRGTENLVHASGSKAEAEYEIGLWFGHSK